MKKIYFIALFLLIAWIASVVEIYKARKSEIRQKNNFEATVSGIRKYYHNEMLEYRTKPVVLTEKKAREIFEDEITMLENRLQMQKVSQMISLKGTASGKIKARVIDTSYNDLSGPHQARYFNYADSNIRISAITINDTTHAAYQYFLRLMIARSLEKRKGIWKKITLQPLKREPVYSAISPDTSLVLTRFSVLEIPRD